MCLFLLCLALSLYYICYVFGVDVDFIIIYLLIINCSFYMKFIKSKYYMILFYINL
jgi:hypothetical protein